jgi:hypothetical protein
VAHSYLRDARYRFLRWGALGKEQQLDERYPAIEEQAAVRPTTSIGAPVEHLDLAKVMSRESKQKPAAIVTRSLFIFADR